MKILGMHIHGTSSIASSGVGSLRSGCVIVDNHVRTQKTDCEFFDKKSLWSISDLEMTSIGKETWASI